jgi:hypothetical protein
LLGTWHSALPAVRALKVATTTDEIAAAKAQLKAALQDQPEVLGRVTRSIEEEGRLAKTSEEMRAVDRAADVAEAEMKGAAMADTAAGHVHVTQGGAVFTCASPCTQMRARYSEVLASAEGTEMLETLRSIEADALTVGLNDKAARKALAQRAAELDGRLAAAALRVRARKVSARLATLTETYPALKDNPLGLEAIERIIGKTNVDHVKGQLLEEMAGAKVQRALATNDQSELTKLAGDRADAALEYIGGDRIRDAHGRQFTDGMLIIRDGDRIEVVAILESKSGPASSKGLRSEYASLKPDGTYKSLKDLDADRDIGTLTDAERTLIEARRHAIDDLSVQQPKVYGNRRIKEIDEAPGAQADIARIMDGMVKTEAGQARQDIERMVSVGVMIDDKPVTVAKGGAASSKIVAVLPTDVKAAKIESTINGGTGQGLNFGTMNVGMSSKDLDGLATDIAGWLADPL